ncbi:MAG: hypothetical protein Q4C23_01705 [Mycoplasmatota bacterium]|nr:hypothetical protein [Mycoplasmatota bacterium]
MNNKGFGLTELIGYTALLGIILLLGITVSVKSSSTAISKIRNVTTGEVKESAKKYITENPSIWEEKNTICIPVTELIEKKYLAEMNEQEMRNKSIEITRNKNHKLKNLEIVNSCN